MKIHLIESEVIEIPSSAMFKTRSTMGVKAYELMVRYFDRARNYINLEERLVPVSDARYELYRENDGSIEKTEATQFMQSMAAFGRSQEAIAIFQQRLTMWKNLSEMTYSSNYNIEHLVRHLNEVLKTLNTEIIESVLKDFISFYNLNSGRRIKLIFTSSLELSRFFVNRTFDASI
ncbi:MAG: hypothetical protein ACK5V3_05580 [Bdellovibrionales bacterium]